VSWQKERDEQGNYPKGDRREKGPTYLFGKARSVMVHDLRPIWDCRPRRNRRGRGRLRSRRGSRRLIEPPAALIIKGKPAILGIGDHISVDPGTLGNGHIPSNQHTIAMDMRRLQNFNIASHDHDVACDCATDLHITAHDDKIAIKHSAFSYLNRTTQDDHIAILSLAVI
jgi:hypothetical protein